MLARWGPAILVLGLLIGGALQLGREQETPPQPTPPSIVLEITPEDWDQLLADAAALRDHYESMTPEEQAVLDGIDDVIDGVEQGTIEINPGEEDSPSLPSQPRAEPSTPTTSRPPASPPTTAPRPSNLPPIVHDLIPPSLTPPSPTSIP